MGTVLFDTQDKRTVPFVFVLCYNNSVCAKTGYVTKYYRLLRR